MHCIDYEDGRTGDPWNERQIDYQGFARLVPELDVFDLGQSKNFWCKILGFQIAYQRSENRFVYIELQGSQVMLNQYNGNWETGTLQRPLGRGINFQMFVNSVAPLLDAPKA